MTFEHAQYIEVVAGQYGKTSGSVPFLTSYVPLSCCVNLSGTDDIQGTRKIGQMRTTPGDRGEPVKGPQAQTISLCLQLQEGTLKLCQLAPRLLCLPHSFGQSFALRSTQSMNVTCTNTCKTNDGYPIESNSIETSAWTWFMWQNWHMYIS